MKLKDVLKYEQQNSSESDIVLRSDECEALLMISTRVRDL